ncbi:MAG TPA: PKD domain-containing protein, partial [Thermoplasmata archaeon]|nr:PKD domain-containing protein [Thermoplasmata archaeon]
LDLPGDFVFDPVASGGVPPYSVTYTANDPYASACRCTVFSSTGNHTVSATVSDSLDAVAVATANVTLYPALSGQFNAAPRSGPAPLQVNFGAALSGGHLANAATIRWEFGDGTNATGALASHVYPNPGYYVATALASDGFGGHASAAFLIDAYANGSAPSTVLTAEVTPALDVPVGVPVNYTATATGSVGPYLIRWGLGDNATAFGPSVSETYPYDCTSGSSCPRSIHLAAEDALGRWTNLTIPLDPVESGNATALTLSLSGVTPRGVTPYTLHAAALAEGMPATSLSWSFGDGGSASGPYGNHTYLSPGNYTVSVRASDPFGDQLIENRAVVVSGIQRYPPTVQASSNVSAGLGPLYVDFSAAASGGSGGPYSYAWSFGDGTNGSGSSAAHLYEHAGSFVANVSATDRIGESATVGVPVRVYAPTPISITISGLPTTLDVGSAVPVSLRERPSCGPDSEPNCTSSTVPLRYLVRSASAPAPVNGTPPAAVLTPNSRGYANFTLPAPASAGAYVLYAWASTNAYYGNGSAAFTANGPTPIQPAKQDLGMEELEGAALALVAALVVTVALVLRRRRRPKPRRSARSDRPPTP